jgi:antitoxin VapB
MGTPQLNIKDAEATRLARELADLTGESQTEVVRKALRERLEREKMERQSREIRTAEETTREFQRMWTETKRIYRRVAGRRRGDKGLTDDDLYDEQGLPK